MRRMRFRASVDLHGKSATGIVVPPEVVEGLGSSKKPKVTVTINGYSYPSSIATMGGRFLIPVSAEVRAGAGVSAGDVVDVGVELDTAPRTVEVPAVFRNCTDPAAEAGESVAVRVTGLPTCWMATGLALRVTVTTVWVLPGSLLWYVVVVVKNSGAS